MEGAGGAIGAARDAIGRGAPAGRRSRLGSDLEGGVRLPGNRVENAWAAVAGASGRSGTGGRRSPGLFALGDRLGGARRPDRGRGNVFPALAYAVRAGGTRRRGSPARPTQKNRLGGARPAVGAGPIGPATVVQPFTVWRSAGRAPTSRSPPGVAMDGGRPRVSHGRSRLFARRPIGAFRSRPPPAGEREARSPSAISRDDATCGALY